MSSLRFGPYTVEISRPDKILFPDCGVTKADLVAHYRTVSRFMLPHLRDRPLTLQRFPDGIAEEGFYQKAISDYFPDWIDRVTVSKQGGEVTHVIASNEATLVYLANQGVITPHVWLSRRDRLDHPDRLIFDLDPSGDDVGLVRDAALAFRALLDELGLPAWPMATGGRGLHVLVPLDRGADFDTVRGFARRAAGVLASRYPDRLTIETSKAKRGGRVFLDYLRNGYAQTAVAPYSVRPRPGAPVAVPLAWGELTTRVNPAGITARNVKHRLEAVGDVWGAIGRRGHGLTGPMTKLAELAGS